MQRLLVVAAGLLLSSSALTQSNTETHSHQTPPSSRSEVPSPQPQNQQVSAKVIAQIRASLESAGLKNVRLAPAFIVRAESENGELVEMLIDAESVAAVNETNDDWSVNDHDSAGQSSGMDESGKGRAAPR